MSCVSKAAISDKEGVLLLVLYKIKSFAYVISVFLLQKVLLNLPPTAAFLRSSQKTGKNVITMPGILDSLLY